MNCFESIYFDVIRFNKVSFDNNFIFKENFKDNTEGSHIPTPSFSNY